MDISNKFLDVATLRSSRYDNINESKNNDMRKVSDDFESFFMNHLLETSLKTSKLAGEGTGSEIIKGMYTDALSQKSSGSLGISDMLFKFLSENK